MPSEPSRAWYGAQPLPHERELLALHDPAQVRVVLEVGACEGLDTIKYLRLFPHAQVHAFEPLPANVAEFEATLGPTGLRDRVTLHPIALGREEGPRPFHVSSGAPPGRSTRDWDYGNKSSSLYAPDRTLEVHPWLAFEEVIEVPVRRLATVAAEHGIDAVDLVHMDVQGAELDVLDGAGDLLAQVQTIWLEVERVPLYRGQPTKRTVEQHLRRRGFRLVHDTVGRISGDQLWTRLAPARPRWWRR